MRTSKIHSYSRSILSAALLATVALVAGACDSVSPAGPDGPDAFASPLFAKSAESVVTALGSASTFGVLGATTVTCTGASTVFGDVGVSPGTAITGFDPDCTATGALHAGDDVAVQAQADAAAAYFSLSEEPCGFLYGDVQQLDGLTLDPGVHCFPSSANLQVDGTLTLSGPGQYIFKLGSTLVTMAGSQVVLDGNAICGDIYWLVGSSATLAGSVVGNLLAHTSIGMDPGASLTGRAIALGGAVTMSGQNTVSDCGDGSRPAPGGTRPGHSHQKCNQGVGNGSEGCDPGNSNQGDETRSNDEAGGTPGNPGKKGGNGKG